MSPESRTACDGCPLGSGRREFLKDVGLSVVAALAAVSLLRPGASLAANVSEVAPSAPAGGAAGRVYSLPAADGISVDVESEVILARWKSRVYAFSLRCPHRGAQLEWRENEQRIYCPKHEARFLGDGAHASGRGTRALDRYAVRRQAGEIVVDTSRTLREDRDAAWADAFIALG